MAKAEAMTATEAVKKLAPLIAKTTGYRMSNELVNFLGTWMETGIVVYDEVARQVATGKPMGRKAVVMFFVNRLNASGALVFDSMKAEAAKCVTSMISAGISSAQLTVTLEAIPLAMLEVTSWIIDVLSMIQDCQKPAGELADSIFKKYDQWLDDASRSLAVQFNGMIYSTMGPSDRPLTPPF